MVIPFAGAATLAALEPLARAMDQLTGAIKESYNFTQKAEKASAALGFSFGDATKKMGPSIAGLRGTIEQQWTTGLLQLDAGLRGTTAGVSKLINQQMLTGTAYKETAKAFARLQLMAGLSNESMNELADATRITGAKYGISTDKIVKAVNTLQQQMVFLNVAGMGTSITGAIAKLQTTLGAAFDEGSMKQLMNLIVNTGMKGMETLAALGIGDIRQRLEAAAGSVDDTFRILKDGIMTAGSQLKQFVGKSSLQFGAFTDALDPAAKLLIPAMQRLAEGAEVNADAQLNFADMMTTLWAEVWNPIKKFVISLQPKMSMFAKVVSSVAQAMVGAAARFMEGLEPSMETFKKLLSKIVDVGRVVTEFAVTNALKLKKITEFIVIPMFMKLAEQVGKTYLQLKDFADNLAGGVVKAAIGASLLAAATVLTGGTALIAAGAGVGMIGWGASEAMGEDKDREKFARDHYLTALGADMRGFNTAMEGLDNQVAEIVPPMEAIKDSMDKNASAWRDQYNSLIAAVDGVNQNTADINAKTLDPRESADAYLGLTDKFLSTSMDQILGLSTRDESQFHLIDMKGYLEELVEINADTNAKTPGGTPPVPSVAPDL